MKRGATRSEAETGVIVEAGAEDWQIYQQDRDGYATIRLRGRWLTATPHKRVEVIVRLVREADLQPVTLGLEWRAAITRRNGTWTAELRRVPRGGLYRLESALRLDGGAVEWSQRGDMAHHLGVGDIWVIAGQSNAAGYGKTPADDAPELGVHLFHACGEWRLATQPLGDSTGSRFPLNREAANASQSPFLAFGRRLKRELGYPIGLIPAALGGSPVSRWSRKVDGDLFRNMLGYIGAAGGAIRGMVWYQGESDTGPDARAVYAARFTEMVRDLRRTLRRPDLPVIAAQLNRCTGEPFGGPGHAGWEVIREIQRQLPKRLPGTYVVGTLDLGISDGIHTDSAGNLVLGQRFADTALGAVYGRPVKYLHPDLRAARWVGVTALELVFDNVDTRLHYESNLREHWPFAVRDEQGPVPIKGWKLTGKAKLRLELERAAHGRVTLVGGPTAYPPSVVPVDICGYRPMLGFRVELAPPGARR